MNRWTEGEGVEEGDKGGVEEEWHLLSGDQTAALKHAELISIVSVYICLLWFIVSLHTASVELYVEPVRFAALCWINTLESDLNKQIKEKEGTGLLKVDELLCFSHSKDEQNIPKMEVLLFFPMLLW